MESNPLTPLKLLCSLKGHKDKIWSLAWHPNGNLLASCSGDKSIRIWSPDPTKPDNYILSDIIEGDHLKTVRSISWSPDGKFLASSSFDSTIIVYHFIGNKFENISKLEGHETEVKCVAWDHTNTYLASCSRDKTIMLWDYEKQDNIYDFSCSNVLNGHDQDVKFVKWKPNSSILFSASYDDTIKVWEQDEDEWICAQTLKGHQSTVWALDFTPDGNYMISVSDDQTVKLWDISAKNYLNNPILNVGTMSGYNERCIYSCSFNFDGQFFVTGGAENQINLYQRNMENNCGENIPSFEIIEKKEMAHENDINCVSFHPKENFLASCSDDCLIKIWKLLDD